MEKISRSGSAITASETELPARGDGMSRCSTALSGSSAAAWVSATTSGSSNTRSMTRSPDVHTQIRIASQPMTSMCGTIRNSIRGSIAEYRKLSMVCAPGFGYQAWGKVTLAGPCRQQAREHATMRQHQSDDLAEHQRDGSVLRNDLLPLVQGSVRGMAQWHLVRSHDLKVLVNVARDAKEWISAHALIR